MAQALSALTLVLGGHAMFLSSEDQLETGPPTLFDSVRGPWLPLHPGAASRSTSAHEAGLLPRQGKLHTFGGLREHQETVPGSYNAWSRGGNARIDVHLVEQQSKVEQYQ